MFIGKIGKGWPIQNQDFEFKTWLHKMRDGFTTNINLTHVQVVDFPPF